MSASAGINATIIGSPAISFYNDTSHIRVDNANTASTSFFPKAHLNLQCDSTTSFVLSSSDLKAHYLFADVARPAAPSPKLLLETLQSWIEQSATSLEAGPFASDYTTTLMEVKQLYNGVPQVSDIDMPGVDNGTTSYDAGMNATVMSISTSQTAYKQRQTKKYASVINNKTSFGLVSATLITNASARNVYTRAGVFDNVGDADAALGGNGVFFQFASGQGLSVVLRSNITGAQVDTVVPQANWNADKLDGSGASSKILDPTEENTFVFEWSPLGGQVIKAGYVQDGRVVVCHQFANVRLGCAKLPLRWEMGRLNIALATTENDACSMVAGLGSIMLLGRNDAVGVTRAMASPVVRSVTRSGPVSVIGLSVQYASRRAHVLPQRLFVTNLDSGYAKWTLRRTATYGTLTPVSNSYAFSVDNPTELSTSTGLVIANGFLGQGITTIDVGQYIDPISSRVNTWNSMDAWFLVVEYLRGVVTVTASIEWMEFE